MRHDAPPEKPVASPALAVSGNDFSPRYLAAKKNIDDRALNRYVWETLRRALPQATGRAPQKKQTKIVEIGAGIGTMVTRVVDWGLLTGPVTYVVTDPVAEHLLAANAYLARWAEQRGHRLSWHDPHHGLLRTAGAEVSLVLVVAGAEELAAGVAGPELFHLLFAHAVLDLIDFPVLLPRLLMRLEENGLAYLTCNFDGETVFLPEWNGPEEKEILRRYHGSMEARLRGASRTGRRLLTFLQGPGLALLAAGSSDWLVHPRNGRYTEGDAFFLHSLIATVEQELAGKKQNRPAPPGLTAWAALRHDQVKAGELSLLARHLDFLAGRRKSPP